MYFELVGFVGKYRRQLLIQTGKIPQRRLYDHEVPRNRKSSDTFMAFQSRFCHFD